MNMKRVMRSSSCTCILACFLVGFLWMEVRVAVAQSCYPSELSPCLPAVLGQVQSPSTLCCTKLKQQRPCLCGYVRNPSLKQYVNSPGAKQVASHCGVSIPNC